LCEAYGGKRTRFSKFIVKYYIRYLPTYGNEKVYPASACLVQQYVGLLIIIYIMTIYYVDVQIKHCRSCHDNTNNNNIMFNTEGFVKNTWGSIVVYCFFQVVPAEAVCGTPIIITITIVTVFCFSIVFFIRSLTRNNF